MKRWIILIAALIITIGYAQKDFTVVWGEDQPNLATLDPRVTQSRHELQIDVQVFDPLIAQDDKGNFYPDLAQSWTVSSDNLCWTFHLRHDVTFQDGTPFNAEAVKFTFDSIEDPKLGSQGAIDFLGPYKDTQVIDPYTAKVCFTKPYAGAEDAFSKAELAPVSPTAVQKMGNDGFAHHPVGAGPFQFVSWEQGKQVVLERNPNYNWAPSFFKHQGPPAAAKLIYRLIPDESTRAAALDSGEISIADLVSPLDLRRYRSSSKFAAMVGVAPGLPYGLLLNTSKGPFQDIRVRQAFMYAVDRPKLDNNLFFGFEAPAYGPLSSTTPGYWSGVESYYKYDPEKAKQLLTAAGWVDTDNSGIREKNGQKLTIFAPTLLEPDTMVGIQSYEKAVGIDLNVQQVLKARQDELIFANNYDILPIRWVLNTPGMVLNIAFSSSNIPHPGFFAFNWARIDSPKLDNLIKETQSALSTTQRDQYAQETQKMIMDEAIFYAVHNQVQLLAYSKKFTGFEFYPGNWQVRMYDVTQAQ